MEDGELSIKSERQGSSRCGAAEVNPTNIHENSVLIPGLSQWVKDPALLWAVVKKKRRRRKGQEEKQIIWYGNKR